MKKVWQVQIYHNERIDTDFDIIETKETCTRLEVNEMRVVKVPNRRSPPNPTR
jgi:hypothetical protein